MRAGGKRRFILDQARAPGGRVLDEAQFRKLLGGGTAAKPPAQGSLL